MKLIITESRRNRAITKWLDENYGNLRKYSVGPRFIIYKDSGDDMSFTFNRDNGIVELSEEISSQLVSIFGITSGDVINDILIPWFMERYNLYVEKVVYTTWHCNKCGRYHITKYHID